MNDFEAKAERLLVLEPDWDSYGAVKITQEAVDAARRFLAIAVEHAQLVPTSDGGVQLEWHANGIDCEIAFDPEGKQTYE